MYLRSLVLLAAVLGPWLASPRPAAARLNGILTSGCNACHTGTRLPEVTLSIDPPQIALGGTATITVRIAASGQGGFYLYSYGKGSFKEIPGQGARLATPTDVIHSTPKNASDGAVTFRVEWTAPSTQGTVNFEALGVAADGNRNQSGDAAGLGRLSVAVGCTGVERFVDTDRDGAGNGKLPKEQVCEGTPGYSEQGDDCNDYLTYVHPGADERCNTLDDDCDGQVDEGLESAIVYRDGDGDGFGDRFTTDMRIGCAASGYAPNKDDCNDMDKTINPGVREICNNKDDDCNGRSDEGARATCGLGWCRRNADGCDARTCTPGAPRAETCNLFDDDCDGAIDNNATCEPGKLCFGGRCLVSEDARAAAEAEAMTTDGGASVLGGGDGGAPPDGGESPTAGDGSEVGTPPATGPAKASSLWACSFGDPARSGPTGGWLLLAIALFGLGRRRSRSR